MLRTRLAPCCWCSNLSKLKYLGPRSQIAFVRPNTRAEGRLCRFVCAGLPVRSVLRSMMLVRILVIVVAICTWGRSQIMFNKPHHDIGFDKIAMAVCARSAFTPRPLERVHLLDRWESSLSCSK